MVYELLKGTIAYLNFSGRVLRVKIFQIVIKKVTSIYLYVSSMLRYQCDRSCIIYTVVSMLFQTKNSQFLLGYSVPSYALSL